MGLPVGTSRQEAKLHKVIRQRIELPVHHVQGGADQPSARTPPWPQPQCSCFVVWNQSSHLQDTSCSPGVRKAETTPLHEASAEDAARASQ